MYRNITEFGTSKLFSLRRSLIFARVRAGEVGWCFVSAKIGTANMQNLFFHFSQFKTVRKKIWSLFSYSVFSDYFWNLWGLNPGNKPHREVLKELWSTIITPDPQIACSLPLCDLKAAVETLKLWRISSECVRAITTAVKQQNSLRLTDYKHSHAHTRARTQTTSAHTNIFKT